MIKQQGNKFILYTKDGTRILGRHTSYEDAVKQARAILISKYSHTKGLLDESVLQVGR